MFNIAETVSCVITIVPVETTRSSGSAVQMLVPPSVSTYGAVCYLVAFLAVPMLHWFTLVAKRREHRVSWKEATWGDMLTNIRLQRQSKR